MGRIIRLRLRELGLVRLDKELGYRNKGAAAV